MAPISREVILSDLDRAKILINKSEKKFYIIPKEIEKLSLRYEQILAKTKKTKYNVVDPDVKANSILEREHVTLDDGIRPIS